MNRINFFKTLTLSYLILSFVSCQIDETQTKDEDNSINLLKIENVNSLSGEARLLAYKMLNSAEKNYLWNKRHEQILISEKNVLTLEQVDFIDEMYNSLKPKYFNLNSKAKYTAYYDEYLPNMKKKGLLLFSIEQMNKYFSNFNSKTSYPHVETQIKSGVVTTFIDGQNNASGIHCNCSSTDDWCNTGECYSWTCGDGDIIDIGCGWWLQEDCDGFCARNGGDK